jgi:aspartate aminotransferase
MPSALARRMSRLGTETAFEVLAKARALEAKGQHIIHLEIGEPDFDTPSHIVEEGRRALQAGATHYGPAAGLPELKSAIAAEMLRSRNLRYEPDEVLVCPGAKPIMFYLLLALIDEGDEVLYPNPGFPIYESMIAFSAGSRFRSRSSKKRICVRRGDVAKSRHRPDAHDHPQYAEQPDGGDP